MVEGRPKKKKKTWIEVATLGRGLINDGPLKPLGLGLWRARQCHCGKIRQSGPGGGPSAGVVNVEQMQRDAKGMFSLRRRFWVAPRRVECCLPFGAHVDDIAHRQKHLKNISSTMMRWIGSTRKIIINHSAGSTVAFIKGFCYE